MKRAHGLDVLVVEDVINFTEDVQHTLQILKSLHVNVLFAWGRHHMGGGRVAESESVDPKWAIGRAACRARSSVERRGRGRRFVRLRVPMQSIVAER